MVKDTLYSIHGHKDVILSRKARIVIFGCFGAKMVYFGGENGHFWGFVMIMSVIIIIRYERHYFPLICLKYLQISSDTEDKAFKV